MKRIIICIGLFIIFTSAGISQSKTSCLPDIVKVIPVTSFDQLTIDGNFKLTLVENDEPAIQIKGNSRFVKAFKVCQKQNALLIKSLYADEYVNNQVIVNVKNLRKLIVQEQSVINTKGILQSEDLNILIDAECFINIINNGITKINASESFDLEIVRMLSHSSIN
ncbi:MAG: DUF2807 domain-containing protein [Chitinophagaceae bacterium]|nr:DUF2807 domain-containing protein [Chitinophagaceae bacterium]